MGLEGARRVWEDGESKGNELCSCELNCIYPRLQAKIKFYDLQSMKFMFSIRNLIEEIHDLLSWNTL